MFRELYYWAYTIYSKKKRFKGKETEYASWLMIGLMSLNCLVFLGFVDYLCIFKWHFSFLNFLFPSGEKTFKGFLIVGILMSPVLLYVYFELVRKKKEIIKHFKEKKMSQFRQDWGKLFFWLYVVFSIAALLVAAVIIRKLRSEAGM